MRRSTNTLSNRGCYEIGINIYEQYLDAYNNTMSRYTDERLSKEYINNLEYHKEYVNRFPFVIESKGGYDFINTIYRIAYKLFGMPHGECEYSDIENYHCMDNLFLESQIIFEDGAFAFPDGVGYAHSHMGDWAIRFLTNTGYDEGYNRLYFKTKEMLDIFLIQLILDQNSTYHVLE